jgi:hypothetical protein
MSAMVGYCCVAAYPETCIHFYVSSLEVVDNIKCYYGHSAFNFVCAVNVWFE